MCAAQRQDRSDLTSSPLAPFALEGTWRKLSSELEAASPTTVAATVASLSPHEQQLIRNALDLLESGPPSLIDEAESGPVSYHITMVDGSDFEVRLSKEATLYDACVVIADQKSVRASEVRLLAAGQSQPMRKMDMQLHLATEGSTEIMAILSSTGGSSPVVYDFGKPKVLHPMRLTTLSSSVTVPSCITCFYFLESLD